MSFAICSARPLAPLSPTGIPGYWDAGMLGYRDAVPSDTGQLSFIAEAVIRWRGVRMLVYQFLASVTLIFNHHISWRNQILNIKGLKALFC